REFVVSTSDFAEYDGGGENPGRDFRIQADVYDNRDAQPGYVLIEFSDPDGNHYTLSGTANEAQIIESDDHTAVSFVIAGTSTSIDSTPTSVSAAGQIRCDSVNEKSSGSP
ncbi:hypothetical protein ACFWPB_23320, partial [Rhodococcus sp. NPDC058514]